MRILLATGIFPPQIGGPATYSKLIYDELPKHGIDVDVVNFGDFIEKPRFVRHFLYFLELLKRGKDSDMIYALDPVSVGLAALFASQIHGKKFMLRIAGDYAWEQGTQRWGVTDKLDDFAPEHESYPWQVRALKRVQKYVADGATRIIVPSGYLKKIVSAWEVNPEKISIVYNGFHVESTKTLKPSLRKRFGLMGSIIISAGRLVPWKGMKELIETMPEIIAAVPDAKLVIVGDGPEEGELKSTAKRLDLENQILFTGRLGQKELFDYIKASDIFALNTSYEGFSHQILEAMAIGTPVVTTEIGGNPEVIRHGRNGVLLDPNDKKGFAEAIVGLLSERAIAFSIATAAKKTVSKFTDEAMLVNISKEIKSI